MSQRPHLARSLEPAEVQLRALGYTIVDDQAEASTLTKVLGTVEVAKTLEPAAATPVAPWSHSDHFGYATFPWHSDGAVSPVPPRWLILECLTLSMPSSTELLAPADHVVRRMRRCAMRVRTRGGRLRYLPAAIPTSEGGVRLRWDPRVCEANDNALADLVEAQSPTAICDWKVGRTLIVDNWRLLHRRPAVVPAGRRRLQQSYIGASNVGL